MSHRIIRKILVISNKLLINFYQLARCLRLTRTSKKLLANIKISSTKLSVSAYSVNIIDTSSSFDFTKRSPKDLENHPPFVDRNLVISGTHAHTREKKKCAKKNCF